MEVLASEIDTEPPWAMPFADDLVLCETSKAAVERELEVKCTHQAERQGVQDSDQANNGIWSRVLSAQKERREQIACRRNEDATMN